MKKNVFSIDARCKGANALCDLYVARYRYLESRRRAFSPPNSVFTKFERAAARETLEAVTTTGGHSKLVTRSPGSVVVPTLAKQHSYYPASLAPSFSVSTTLHNSIFFRHSGPRNQSSVRLSLNSKSKKVESSARKFLNRSSAPDIYLSRSRK